MQLPIVAPAPVVTAHADIFRDLFENRCQFRHFQNYLTGLIVLDNKSLANITLYSQNIRTRLPTGSYASTTAVLRLVFLSTITDTHRQYGWKAAGER